MNQPALPTVSAAPRRNSARLYLAGGALFAIGLWSYWTTLGELLHCWYSQPDYSHGLLVPVIGGVVLYLRRASMPECSPQWSWCGVALIAVAMLLKVAGAALYFDAADYWSLVLWIAAAVTLLGGARMARWMWPAFVFLLLAMPLPFHIEQWCSRPLQGIATRGSVVILQTFGVPAFAEGNVILLGNQQLEVERACAGLRIFIGITALTIVAAAISPKSVIERSLLVLSAFPVALAANIARIVATALCFAYGPAHFAQTIGHDGAGLLMIPLAVALIAGVHWYLNRLIVEAPQLVGIAEVVRRPQR